MNLNTSFALLVLLALGCAKTDASILSMKWERPRISQNSEGYFGFSNNFRDYSESYHTVKFDACGNSITKKYRNSVLQWEFFLANGSTSGNRFGILERIQYPSNTTNCEFYFRAPKEARFHARVTLFDAGILIESQSIEFYVKNFWLLVMGDSFVSGQGNPDRVSALFVPPEWIDKDCYRSSRSFSFKLYERIAKKYPRLGIQFTYLPCSGAEIEEGLLGSQTAHLGATVEPQFSRYTKIRRGILERCCQDDCKSSPDLVILGIGGNDAGFIEVVVAVMLGVIDQELPRIPPRIEQFEIKLDELNNKFLVNGIRPESVFYVSTYTGMRDQRGKFKATCGKVGFASDDDFGKVYQSMIAPLRDVMQRKSKTYGWNFVDVLDVYRRHGICSSKSFIRAIDESLFLQADFFGAIHPNERGHRATARAVWPRIERKLDKLRLQ